MQILLLILTSLFVMNISAAKEPNSASNEDKHEEKMELPAGIISFHDEEGEFKLRPNVIKNFGITYERANKTDQFIKVPASAVVRSLKETSIFVFDKDSFRHIKVTVLKTENNISYLKSSEDINGKLVVNKGTNFLKTILLSLEEGPSEGHGH